MFKKIRWRIAVPYILLILLALFILGIYIASFIENIYVANLEEKLLVESRLLAEQLVNESYLLSDGDELDNHAKRWAEILGTRVTIIAADGTVLGESDEDRLQMDNHQNRPEVIRAMSNGTGSSIRFSQTVGYQMLYTAYAIRSEHKIIGFVRLSVALKQIEAYVVNLRRTLIVAALVVTGLATTLAIVIAEGVTRPLRILTRAAQKVSVNEQLWREHARIPMLTHDEIGLVTQSFNEMIAQLGLKIEEQRIESSKLNAVLNQMTDGVVIIDREGDILLINPAAEKIFETDQSKALGKPYVEIVRHHQLMDIYSQCKISGDIQLVVLDMPLSKLYLQAITIPLGSALPGAILVIFQDLTKLHHLETVRRDFISNISHELRTPLASLKVITETLLDTSLEDETTARQFLIKMDTEIDALSLMVAELLELTRIESGKVPLVFTETSPCDILNKANDRLLLQAERAELIVEIKCPPDLPMVFVDPPRIEQVVVNLLHNAIKFTPQGGKITLTAELSSLEAGLQVLKFSVSDTGLGIAPEDLPRIFERFYKVDRARSGGGTGLGLAIAKHIIDLHHGKIWADSRQGEGSTFYFTIPLGLDV